ncbi:GNAT family N-acetyltransferase [Saccharopolyspora sp. K220]|uniref:GNAT family N-acetyltransferase n=1 Tax=Saccharopolyspora soli TaxID=2926618 RepID=UPI001F598107|nr:GNAT family N-acetyltransferase [Saccharopolyspora soli]MCI2423541.1 GNAT family N-acetyltransferase [Saccharopolyspora soli]
MGRVFVETERLVLREVEPDDADAIFSLNNDAEVMRFLNGGASADRAQIAGELIPSYLAGYQRFGGLGRLAAIEKAGDRFVGVFKFQPTDDGPLDEVELGYRLHRSVWGRGYATEGSLALIRKGFTELGLGRIWAKTMTVNRRSQRVMQKAGLRYVRTFFEEWPEGPIEGSEHGDVEYELTRDEWLAMGS